LLGDIKHQNVDLWRIFFPEPSFIVVDAQLKLWLDGYKRAQSFAAQSDCTSAMIGTFPDMNIVVYSSSVTVHSPAWAWSRSPRKKPPGTISAPICARRADQISSRLGPKIDLK